MTYQQLLKGLRTVAQKADEVRQAYRRSRYQTPSEEAQDEAAGWLNMCALSALIHLKELEDLPLDSNSRAAWEWNLSVLEIRLASMHQILTIEVTP